MCEAKSEHSTGFGLSLAPGQDPGQEELPWGYPPHPMVLLPVCILEMCNLAKRSRRSRCYLGGFGGPVCHGDGHLVLRVAAERGMER